MISQSDYMNFLKCPKLYWTKKNNAKLYQELYDQNKMISYKQEVYPYAKQTFNAYTMVEINPGDVQSRYADTNAIINLDRRHNTIAGATFIHDKMLTASCDFLQRGEEGWILYALSAATSIKEYNLQELAFQLYILRQYGLNVNSIKMKYINGKYVKRDATSLYGLFNIVDVTDDVEALYEQTIININAMLKLDVEPTTAINASCVKDSIDCVCKSHCWKNIPANSVFDINGKYMKFKTKLKHYNNGIESFKDLLTNDLKLSDNVLKQISSREHVDVENIQNFLSGMKFPLYFLDFETYMHPVPMFDNLSPYQQIPFQYSLHIMHDIDSLEHIEFIADYRVDPRKSFVESLINNIPADVCVVAYSNFEQCRIKELADLYPVFAERLMTIHDNVVDLEIPFKNGYYYNYKMKGHSSIKYVLPALVDKNGYKDLAIQNGMTAMVKYGSLSSNRLDNNEKAKIIQNLLAYCKCDTLSMVKIYLELKNMVNYTIANHIEETIN